MRTLPVVIGLGTIGLLGAIAILEYSGDGSAGFFRPQPAPAVQESAGSTSPRVSPRVDRELAVADTAAPAQRKPQDSGKPQDSQAQRPAEPQTEETPEQHWLSVYGEMDVNDLGEAYQSLAASQHQWMLDEFHRQIDGGLLQPTVYENSDALNAGVNAGEQTTGWGTFAMQQVTSEEDGRYLVYSATFHADEFEKTRELSEELLWLKRRIHEVSGK